MPDTVSEIRKQTFGKRLFQAVLNVAVRVVLRPKVIYLDDGMKKKKDGAHYVFVCNHTDHMDGVCVASALKRYRPFALVSRKWYDKKFYGGMIRKTRSIPISLDELDASWYQTGEVLLRENESMLIFPEGAIAREGKMLPFKPGAGLLSAKTGVPVVPVASYGEYKKFFGRRQRIVVGKPILSECPNDVRFSRYAKELMAESEKEVRRLYGMMEQQYGRTGVYFEECFSDQSESAEQ